MIVITVESGCVREVYNYPEGTDTVIILDKDAGESGDNPVSGFFEPQDITDMDDDDIAVLNSSKKFCREFGSLVRVGANRKVGRL